MIVYPSITILSLVGITSALDDVCVECYTNSENEYSFQFVIPNRDIWFNFFIEIERHRISPMISNKRVIKWEEKEVFVKFDKHEIRVIMQDLLQRTPS
jgi:hypothetical protein